MSTETQPAKSQVALREEAILKFWRDNTIFEKSLFKNSGAKEFVFYDGPPFATGLPHYGHILPGTIKDVIPRFQTMNGRYVRRKWGWDCHGLPVENLIEKELGLKSKKDIEALGVGKFNKAARDSVMRYASDWKELIPRTGRWVNMEDDYKTMDTSYTESVWWAFKTLHEKNLAYESFKSMHICPRCETTLSNFEVNQGYKDIADLSVYAKFKLKGEFEGVKDISFIAWTTTPWTLPGNAALAVNPEVDYVVVSIAGAKYILAKPRLSVLKEEYIIEKEFKGAKLVGLSYEPVFPYYAHSEKIPAGQKANGWKVYGAEFVTTEDGSGIVHIAPAFGSDDMELGKKHDLPFIQHVTTSGVFKPEVTDFAGQAVKPKSEEGAEKDAHQRADIEIIKYLAGKGLLFAKEKITHSYPHCWRCDTPLLNYATTSWFVKVTALKDALLKENEKVNWIPSHVKDGRFGKWLEGAKDWGVSRQRFWGAPLPVWKCSECEHVEVIGSIDELKSKIKPANTYYVVRHGESHANVAGLIDNKVGLQGLTKLGFEQVNSAVEQLKDKKIDLIIHSPYLRTRETAEIIRKGLGLKTDQLVCEERIEEVKTGIFDGRPVADYHSYFSSYEDRWVKAPPQGETQAQLKTRLGDFIYSCEKEYTGKNILIVSHDTPSWLLFAAAYGWNRKTAMDVHAMDRWFLRNAEVRKLDFVPIPHNEEYELDLHRPGIDEVEYNCRKGECKGKMKRIPDVFDTWFDSGSVSFAQFHYPFENKDLFNPTSIPLIRPSRNFPADFVGEGLDQTRGWFYTMMVLSVALFGKAPFKNVVVNGLLLAEDGRKMSKRLKNYPELMDMINKYGADALRYFLMASPAVHADDYAFSEKAVDEVQKKLVLRLQNVVSFYEMYAGGITVADLKPSKAMLDRWIITRLNQVIGEVTVALTNYEIDRAARPLDLFIDDFSTWYLRRSRDRLKAESPDRNEALHTLRFVLLEFAKVVAPFMPFIAEDVHQRMRFGHGEESVHLENWPKAGSVDENLLATMASVRAVVSQGLESRSKANVKVRQPLAQLTIRASSSDDVADAACVALIKDEVNVKEVMFDDKLDAPVVLDTSLTPDLINEGYYRDFLRALQEMRKKLNLKPGEVVSVVIDTSIEGKNILNAFEADMKKAASVSELTFAPTSGAGEVITAGPQSFTVVMKRV